MWSGFKVVKWCRKSDLSQKFEYIDFDLKMWPGSTPPAGTPGRTVTSTTSPENNEAIFEEMGACRGERIVFW